MAETIKKNNARKFTLLAILLGSAIVTGILVIPYYIDSKKIEIITVEPTPDRTTDNLLFSVHGNEGENYVIENRVTIFTNPVIKLRFDLPDFYIEMMAPRDQSTLVIYPIFTANAYKDGGFYDYYRGDCDKTCLKIQLDAEHFSGKSSTVGFHVLQELGYEFTSDSHVSNDPTILQKYDRIILLHNEYVTKEMYDAIRSHPKVIYLYPNALYAEVEFDGSFGWVELIKGHGYPDKSISNGFNFPNDNSQFEYDILCNDPFFYKVDNGWMLSCYPEEALLYNKDLLEKLQDL